MPPFSPLLLSNALIEGLSSISTLVIQEDKEMVNAIKKIIVSQFNFFPPTLGQKMHFTAFDKNLIVDSYNKKK
jgi:hypothetical protein